MDPNARDSLAPRRPAPDRQSPQYGAPADRAPRGGGRDRPPRDREPFERTPPRGFRIGPLLVTPVRLMLVLAVLGSLAYVAYALTVRDTAQLPLLSSGAAVLGIAFIALAVSGFLGIRQAGFEGRDGWAVLLALFGGLSAIVGFGCFAMAIVLAMEA